MPKGWRQRLNANAALRRLLPLLLPPGWVDADSGAQRALREPGWAELACERGLGSCFSVFLRQGGFWNCLLPVVQDQLDAAYRENLAKWVLREQVLCELLSLFVPLGTRPVLLKGFAFASQLYPDPGARQVGDIDLLIDRRWKSEVHEKLGRAGFRLISQAAAPVKPRKPLVRCVRRLIGTCAEPAVLGGNGGDEGEAVYLCQLGGEDILVEIHYHLINLRAGGGKEEVFRSRSEAAPRTRDVRLAGTAVRVLDHGAAFLHALRHLALHHRFIGFRWHHDLALMLVHWERHLDPVRIRERCRELNSEKMLEVELALLEELFGPGVLSEGGRMAWRRGSLPWEYPLYRYIARGGKRTPWREIVRTLLAPSLREQLDTLT